MMSEEASTAIHNDGSPPEGEKPQNNHNHKYSTRKERPPRACTARSAARLYQAALAVERKQILSKKEKQEQQQQQQQCSKIITPLVNEPPPSQLPRWSLRSMWELASLLNFLHVFRPLLNITVEFSAEEVETALITPNSTLDDLHIPLLKAIPPVTRMALGRATWVTVLCRKLRDWWHWVAEGEVPIVASHGTEVEVYKALDPGTRLVILKALCDIRVEQEDIRNYIDDSIKHGIQLSAFRKERIGGDSHGVSYWYEDDPIIGHRLYREIRKIEVKKLKAKGSPHIPTISCQWEAVATNLDEFQDVSEKLFSSKNKTEAAVGKKLKVDMLPEIEKIHKRKERLLKKQHRQALLLDSFLNTDGVAAGRSLRDRKPVTYTFDDYDRSINEAIKITKRKQPSPDHVIKREVGMKSEPSTNGKWHGPSHALQQLPYDALSPKSTDYEDTDTENYKSGPLDRSNRRRQRPQRYSEKEFVEAVSDNEADFDSDDDIVGEAVYDEEYLRSRKQRKKVSSSSEGDEEYRWDENAEDEEEEEEDSLSVSEDTDEHLRSKKFPGRSRRGAKLRSVDELQSGLRRSKRATRNQINYQQYELSGSEGDSVKHEKSNASDRQSDASDDLEYSMGSQDSHGDEDDEEGKVDQPVQENHETVEKEQSQPPEKSNGTGEEEYNSGRKRRFLDLNELAPVTGFDDGPGTPIKDENTDNF
ncbi:DDT domain-containing protein DDR4-like [Macadamia integrifolia]|uniref:DDT domain-containing protein DDR4-like n=1 Tax=Macadamia integrifolia TaxID=60698 RepID=UPI001C4FD750|nr:DDT domain-containing protein DDR4-like [Macadamia integrifolia]XP_042501605.1 DDT domain-containing protein DDR4-like [Macadamia integrifolia]